MTLNHDPNSEPSGVSGKPKALLIAVESNSLKDHPRLYRAQPDAETLKLLLIEQYGYREENITLMMDLRSHPKHLWPTKKNVRKQIQIFVQGVSPGDHLFFYYSGHGCQMSCHDHTETDGLDEAIYTCNGKVIVDNDLKRWLVNPLPPGCKLFALCDSCHSRTILDLDHYNCNEPKSVRFHHITEFQSLLRRVLPKGFRRKSVPWAPKRSFTTPSHEFLSKRAATQTSASITAVSVGGSPRLSGKWLLFPSSLEVQRVLSPTSFFKCDGECTLPTDADKQRAHVISLSACRDNEIAVDDSQNGTVTQFFVDHLRAEPKSTLRELLVAIRKRVDEITAARQAYQDAEARAAARQIDLPNGRGSRTHWIPQAVHRSIEVNVSSLEEFLRLTPSTTREEEKSTCSQQPSYSSHYRLDLDEPVDL